MSLRYSRQTESIQANADQKAASVDHHRLLLVFASSVYLLWWIVVHLMFPLSFNPFLSRLAVCASFLLVLALSFCSSWTRLYIERLYALSAYALTLHYFYLFSHNPEDMNWVVGAYITVLGVGMTFDRFAMLAGFILIVLGATWYVVSMDPSAAIAIPGMATMLVLIPFVMFLRGRADQERQQRIKAEAERASIEAVSRAKSLFLANMSHELRTPLTSVMGFSELLSDAPELSADSQESLAHIRSSARLLMETVDQILNLTEEDFNQLDFDLAPLSLRELITRQMTDMVAAADAKHIALSLKVQEPLCDGIVGDAGNIERILRNVLGNAIKFTASGQITVELSTEVLETSVWVTFIVQDTGIGIAKHEFEKVFDPFQQGQEGYTRPYGGVGLGLTVARKIARAMGGDIMIAESALGHGTVVRITLKAQRP